MDRSTDEFISNLSCDSSDGENYDGENFEVEREIFRRKLRESRNQTTQPTASDNLRKQQSAPTISKQQEIIHKQQSVQEQNPSSNASQSNQSATRKANWKLWF